MNKLILFCVSLVILTTTELQAQRYCWAQRYSWGCNRYMPLTEANYDGNYYGYVDNINYPEPYHLPLNYYFNYRKPCCRNFSNYQYLMECVRYTRGGRYSGSTFAE